MREIIFEGFHKRETGKDKIFLNGEWIQGEWVEGNLFVDEKKEKYEILVGYVNYRISWEVIPETVGQYTGLKDRNGVKIFEGDIVKIYDCLGRCEGIGKIQWNELFLAWHTGKCASMYGNYIASYEIIGNIYSNPELLEVEECRNFVKKTISMR